MYTSPVPDCLCTSVATLPTYVQYMIGTVTCVCTLMTERHSFFHKTTRYSIVFFHMIHIITPINATVASNSLALKHKHFWVYQLLALLKRCNRRVQPSYKLMLLRLVAIYARITHMYTSTYCIAMTKYACLGVFTVYRHLAYIRMCMYLFTQSIYRCVRT